jgi:SAM-dependent methyltransferase
LKSPVANTCAVLSWALWDGQLAPELELLAAALKPLLVDMNKPDNPTLYTWYEHAQWRWKQWEYASMIQAVGDHPEGRRILDAGCGYTPLIRYFASLGADAYGFDWDLSAAESDLATSSTLSFGDRVRYVQQDIRAMSWPSDYFDSTLSVSVLEHLYQATNIPTKVFDRLSGAHKPFHYRNVARALAELVRVTKPGGTIAVTMDCGYGGGIPAGEVERLFGISFPAFPDIDTIRGYWSQDEYYSQRNLVFPGTPREYTGFLVVLQKNGGQGHL